MADPCPVNPRLDRTFFARPASAVARGLVGAVLCRRWRGRVLRARVVETEAYVGCHDLACHASRGRTARTAVMFGPAGRAYVYLVYGLHDMLNVVTGPVGDAQAVLIRAAEPLDGWAANLTGPGRLARAMNVTVRRDNAADMTAPGAALYVTAPDPRAAPPRVVTTPRIGVDYAGDWAHAPLRFVDADSRATSRNGQWPRVNGQGMTKGQ